MNRLRIGDFILFNKEHPCRITAMQKSKPGKHGSAKCTLEGKNLLNDKKHTMTLRGHDTPHYIDVSRRTLYCSYFEDDYAYVMDDNDEEEPIVITKKELIDQQSDYPDGCDVVLMDIKYEINDEKISHTIVMELKNMSE